MGLGGQSQPTFPAPMITCPARLDFSALWPPEEIERRHCPRLPRISGCEGCAPTAMKWGRRITNLLEGLRSIRRQPGEGDLLHDPASSFWKISTGNRLPGRRSHLSPAEPGWSKTTAVCLHPELQRTERPAGPAPMTATSCPWGSEAQALALSRPAEHRDVHGLRNAAPGAAIHAR